LSNSKKPTSTESNEQSSSRGGKRPGSGRPSGSGKYGEPTKAIRVPEGSVTLIKDYLSNHYRTDSNASSSIASSVDTDESENNINLSGKEISFLGAANQDEASVEIPMFSNKVAAGYPAYADDHMDTAIDINDYLVESPNSTFMLKVEGESMKNAGILPDDVLIVDRSKKAKHNKIVIAALDGELTVKRLYQRGNTVKLLPENEDYPEIEVSEQSTFVIWGVVVGSFRRFETTFF